MKKHLIIAFAICVLFLSACGSLVEMSQPLSNTTVHSTVPIATASKQSVCQVLHDRQAQLNQEYRATNAQLATAQAEGNLLQVVETEKTLIRLHQFIVQVQAQAC